MPDSENYGREDGRDVGSFAAAADHHFHIASLAGNARQWHRDWRGEVKHLASRDLRYFRKREEIAEFAPAMLCESPGCCDRQSYIDSD